MSDPQPSCRIALTGVASLRVTSASDFAALVDPLPYLRTRKSRKYLSPQDDLAVVCAGRALADAGLVSSMLGSNAALAMCVGFLSFDRKDTDPVVALSAGANGEFSMTRFAAEGMRKTHPLLTFRCLPNMPAFHVSVNFDIRGPYLATYPGIAQTYGCIEQAVRWLRDGKVAVALVGAVAHQHNFLVEHHLSRVAYPADLTAICDAGAVFVLEREADAHKRGATVSAVLERCERSYLARDMLEDPGPALSDTATDEPLALGCASMMVALSEHIAQRRTSPAETLDPTHAVHANNLQNKRWTHSAQSLDGHFVSSSWELLC